MNTKWFIETCKREYEFLEKVFGLKITKTDIRDVGAEIIFKNDTTGVRIWWEYREFFVFVYVCQLVEGDLILPSGEIGPNTKLHCYDLEDFVALRSPESIIPAHQPDTLLSIETLKSIIRKQAINMENCAKDALSGDFSIFERLDEIVKARAREAAFKKWGEQASKYGW